MPAASFPSPSSAVLPTSRNYRVIILCSGRETRPAPALPDGGSGDKTRNPTLGSLCKATMLSNTKILLGAGAVGGATVALVAFPMVLGAVGFTKAGIAAGSMAAKMMSGAAIANGGGIASGSLVAVLQSVGAGGLSTMASTALGSAGSVLGSALAYWSSK
ncbi:interferon alpha-inducible protein 27, mitochondrial-like [Dromiciops gliroides]|uniref:interferon alpha-inducible protein 27, mitochondrial-like n=1 Tax=Dromiciops gliroides TaxID=33562 RepID=UPI001CC3E25D|nr:interferon alpha-inducible protein 27, mitochondrial-like [Dromiciops gliroides]